MSTTETGTDARDTRLTDAGPPPRTERQLRAILFTNATTSGLGGTLALVAGEPVADLLGTEAVTWVRLVGAGLMAFAAFVAWVGRSPRTRLLKETPMISLGDLAWVAGTAASIGLSWFSTRGAVVMAAVAAMVGVFGVSQLVLTRRMGRGRQTTASPTGVS